MSFKFKPKPVSKSVEVPGLPDVVYIPGFFAKEQSDDFLKRIISDVEFSPETYTFNDNVVTTKRKISYHSDKMYSYSNQVYSGKPWNEVLLEIKGLVEGYLKEEFNAVLVNHYCDGEAGMGWHADKERKLGLTPTIASISLGQSRRFAFRHRRDVIGEKNPPILAEYTLNSGDLLIMRGTTQQFFEHTLLKDKSAKETRVNLTYRKIID